LSQIVVQRGRRAVVEWEFPAWNLIGTRHANRRFIGSNYFGLSDLGDLGRPLLALPRRCRNPSR